MINSAAEEAENHKRKFKKNLLSLDEPSAFDHVWAVIDTDVAVRMGLWNEVQQLASSRNVKLAHSTPCFEYWLLLHIVDFTTRGDLHNGEVAKKAVKEALGCEYSTNLQTARYSIPKFIAGWRKAVESANQARRHHIGARTPSPANPSTDVDYLVMDMANSTLPHRTNSIQGNQSCF